MTPYDPRKHNYLAKVMALMATVERGRGYVATIRHDSWCGIYTGGYCDCDPGVSIKTATEPLAEETRN